jgi:hypothetical protein
MGAILGIAGLATSAYGQYKSGQDAAAVYKYNQQLAKYQEKYINEDAAIQQTQLKKDVAQYIGRQRAITGASGTQASSSSNLRTIEATQREADIDAAIIRYRADIGVWEAKNQANLLGTQANQFSVGGYLNSGSTILTGLSKWDYRNLMSNSSTSTSPTLTTRQQRLGV